MKIASMQFFGAAFFAYPFWDGLEALALTFPMLHFVARMYRDLPPAEASCLLSGEKATPKTGKACPCIVARTRPVAASTRRIR